MASTKAGYGFSFQAAGVSFFAFLVLLLFRTTGIHCDENNYLQLAVTSPFGDSAETSKPVLVYLLNYGFYHAIGAHLAELRVVSLHLGYALLSAVSCGILATGLFEGLLLTVLPLVALNGTQVMMETLILPAMALVFVLSMARLKTRHVPVVAISAAIAVVLKTSVAPALLILAISSALRERWKAVVALACGIAVGAIANTYLLRWVVRARTGVDYWAIGQVFEPGMLSARLALTGKYAAAWLFFGGLVGMAGILSQVLAGDREWRETAGLVAGSAAACFVVQLGSRYDFIRYAYPAILISLFAGFRALARTGSRTTLAAVLVLNVLFTAGLVRRDAERLAWWPELFRYELQGNGGTAFSGYPVHLWEIFHSAPDCVEATGPEANHWTLQYLGWEYPNVKVEAHCANPASFRIRSGVLDQSSRPCSHGCACAERRVTYFSDNPGLNWSEVCF